MKTMYLKIREKLDKILTFQFDKQKHLNGALFANWIIFFVYLFLGKNSGIIAMIFFILVSILWEFGTKKFSFLDIIFFVIGIVPVSVFILIN